MAFLMILCRMVEIKEMIKIERAGKTDGLDGKTFGLVIFEAEDLETARRTMMADPALVTGIMTADLYPYTIALIRS